MDECLGSTWYIDAGHPDVRQKAEELTLSISSQQEQAKALFRFVRDQFPYRIIYEIPERDYFKASVTLKRGDGFCMPKSILLAALSRAVGIPSRLHFADIRNHILPPTTLERLKTDVMALHTYVELLLGGKWVKATPSFDLKFCEKFGLVPVDFDGEHDAKDSPHNVKGEPHIEHIGYHGPYADFPWDEVRDYYKKWLAQMGFDYDEMAKMGDEVRQQKLKRKG